MPISAEEARLRIFTAVVTGLVTSHPALPESQLRSLQERANNYTSALLEVWENVYAPAETPEAGQ